MGYLKQIYYIITVIKVHVNDHARIAAYILVRIALDLYLY